MTAAAKPATAVRKVLIVALGNPDRGDDGVGAMVARALDGRLPAEVTIAVVSGDVLSLVQTWEGFDAVVCIDAAAPMTVPGRVHRLDLADAELPRDACLTSSHGLGLAEAIALGRALQSAPREIVVLAVEGAQFGRGTAMTPAVAAVVGTVGDQVVAEIVRLRDGVGVAV